MMRPVSCALPVSIRQLGRKRRMTKAETAFRVLPQPFLFVQQADRARHRVELVSGKTLRNVGEVERRLFQHGCDLFSELSDRLRRSFFGLTVGLAVDIV